LPTSSLLTHPATGASTSPAVTPPTEFNWTHLNRLGSPIAISAENGSLREKLAYDAWGKRRTLTGANLSTTVTTPTPDSLDGVVDNRGFTGHEMLDQLDLVHMNGRIYDPLVGRFLSADPILQDPMNGQSYNRYSYVLNNPTNLTDPTGFEFVNMDNCTPTPNGSSCAFGSAPPASNGNGAGDGTSGATAASAKLTTNSSGTKNVNPKNKTESLLAACGQCNRSHGDGLSPEAQSAVLDVLPEVGSVKSVTQLITGKDLLTGENTNRWIEAAGLALGIVPGGKSLTKLRSLAKVEEAAKGAVASENLVYQSVNAAGIVNYVGITNSLERRAAEHLSSKGISIDAIPGLGNLSRADAKAVEQVLIENHGLAKNSGALMNKINSIASSNPAYAEALQRGGELLKQAGYRGF